MYTLVSLSICSCAIRGLVCVSGGTLHVSRTIFLCFDERLQVVFVVVLVSPHSDVANEVWVCVGIVQSYHDPSVDQFVHMSEHLYRRL